MDSAALILWILTAGGGFYLFATWISKGGARRPPAGESNFRPGLVFSHFLLAAAGLVVWIVYVVSDKKALAWTAFVLLAVVALLGFTMLGRWIPTYRAQGARTKVAAGGHQEAEVRSGDGPAERHFPVAIVVGHGVLAATTLVLVLLAALGS